MGNYFKYKDRFTLKQVEAAAKEASISGFLKKLGMNVNNGNYKQAKKIAKFFKVKLPLYSPSEQCKSLKFKNKISDAEFFQKGISRNGTLIRKRLIEDHGHKNACSNLECPVKTNVWCGKPIVFQVDHIDGDSFNNKLDNLRLLCANCHTQTPTFGNAGKTKRYNYCKCGEKISKKAKLCRSCSAKTNKKEKIKWPNVGEVAEMVNGSSMLSVSRKLGVSDNAIRKFLKRNI